MEHWKNEKWIELLNSYKQKSLCIMRMIKVYLLWDKTKVYVLTASQSQRKIDESTWLEDLKKKLM